MTRRATVVGATGSDPGAVVLVDVSGIADPDAGSVGALARLTLDARRRGLRVLFVNASPELRGLVALVGLAGIVRCSRRVGRPGPGRSRPGGVVRGAGGVSRGAGEGRTAGRSAGYRGRT